MLKTAHILIGWLILQTVNARTGYGVETRRPLGGIQRGNVRSTMDDLWAVVHGLRLFYTRNHSAAQLGESCGVNAVRVMTRLLESGDNFNLDDR